MGPPGRYVEPLADGSARGITLPGLNDFYWITSSARASSDGGIVSPRALAVLSRVEDWRGTGRLPLAVSAVSSFVPV
jgi:hypothetical protein